uniref:HMMR_C domain-containing protein n=1 Tax=Elaeophora elaphi TaxID=1147741 RepID=A0A0R3RR68_9BILA
MATTPTTCSQCVAYNEQLNSKAEEVKTLQEHILKLAHELQDESKKKEEVQERLNDKLIRLNDYAIKIRSLEEQLQSATDRRPIGEISRAEVNSIIGRDLERIHSQLIEKDIKIMELNDTVLEKERHIIELQEMCREQEEIMQAKAKAFHIIQQKLLDLGTRTTREDSTETEAAYVFESLSPLSSLQQSQKERRRQHDFFSPGHAVVHLKMGSSGSPPPIDPSEECSSLTQDNGNIQDDFDADDGGSASFLYKKKHRKRVTFDLPPRKEFRNGNGQEEGDDITQTIIDVTAENDQLRQTIQEMEKCASDSQNHLSQLQTQLDEMRRNGRNQVLKTRASMQGKIRDLEDKISTMSVEHTDRVEHLNASIETLRADREWTLEENARLLKLLSSYREKLNDAWEALDARQEESKELRSKLDNDRALIVQLADDLEEAQQTANILLEQKISVLDDVERLKEALEAQDQYIELLEKDTMIYEEHVGLLRDSLGASKAERKALIRSKAYEAKLKALEQEKEQMNRRSNGKLNFSKNNLKMRTAGDLERALIF